MGIRDHVTVNVWVFFVYQVQLRTSGAVSVWLLLHLLLITDRFKRINEVWSHQTTVSGIVARQWIDLTWIFLDLLCYCSYLLLLL